MGKKQKAFLRLRSQDLICTEGGRGEKVKDELGLECGELLVWTGTGGTWGQRADTGAMAWHRGQGMESWGEGGSRENCVRTPGKASGFGDQKGVVKTTKVPLIQNSDTEYLCVGSTGVD